MKKKSIVILFLAAFLIFGLKFNSASAAGISIYINGDKQTFSNQAIIENGTTLVPLRGIFEALGAKVQWNGKDQTISASKGNTNIWLKLGWGIASVNGKQVKLNVSPKAINGITLVPLRFISESLGESVKWDSSTSSVHIGSDGVGTLKGTITYQYNKYIGTRPDVGADVILFPKNFKPVTAKQIVDVEDGKIDASSIGIYFTEVDGYGNYQLDRIPSGEYLVLITSLKTYTNFMEPMNSEDEKLLKKYISDFEEGDLGVGLFNYMIKHIKLEPGEEEIISKDWGYSYM